MQENLVGVLNFFGLAWWIEIKTDSPRCTYFFGPFSSQAEAESEQPGFVEDLRGENAQGISVVIKRCKPPASLTIFDEIEEERGNISPSFSSQIP